MVQDVTSPDKDFNGEIKNEKKEDSKEVNASSRGNPDIPQEEDFDLEDEAEKPDPELARLYEETLADIEEGSIVRGSIVQITDTEVLIDIGYKSEGTIPLREFKTVTGAPMEIKIGDQIDVYLESTEDEEGLVVLSKEKADRIQIWDQMAKAHEENRVVEGVVVEKIKGGLTVDIGVRSFLPGSQVDLRPVKNLESFIGQTIKAKIIKLNRRRGNIVLSRRAILEEERGALRKQTLQQIEEGKILKGIVKNVTEYGAFIDLGGIDGLLHITDMSWGRINHPSEILTVGSEIEVKVLKFDREKEKVSLGLKQKYPDPWETADQKYPVGSKVRGKVVSVTDYGAFVELEPGVEGLVHISEMSWTKKVKHPSKIANVGDMVEAVVLDLDKANRRISLGLKQMEPNPWTVVAEKYPVGSVVRGTVRNLTDFGAFVELEEGIDGLVHISDMSWTSRVKHPSEIVKKGDVVEAVVLGIDVEKERLSLGFKQLQPDPWQGISNQILVGANVKGKVVRLTDFGAFVELENGVEGLLHVSEISKKRIKKPSDVLSEGQEIMAKVIKLDEANRRIGLSIKAYKEEVGETEQDEETESTGHEAEVPQAQTEAESSEDKPAQET
ncbi:MAG TPA: 30S ribosomal protein S1 [Candidatus Limnocylindrales bacterium]|nr:30S ribosomal protein S1 [Candidatus Limnocylindrales bacterium]